MEKLNGSVAVITGGGGPHGIGRATGKLLAEQGGRVVLADINSDALDTTVSELKKQGLDVTGVQVDVADFGSVQALADSVYERHGRVDIAFLNAGVAGAADLTDGDVGHWHTAMGVNVYGVLHGIKAFVPRMMDQGTPGHVLGTSSGAGVTGVNYRTPAYAVSKQAVCTLMECLHGYLRDCRSLIQAHVVFPPLTKTGLAGDPEVMRLVQQGLEATGVPAVLAEPEQVAVTVVEAIRNGDFWARHHHDADKRLYGGKFEADIDWQDQTVRARADCIINRLAPDPYLWGGPA